MDKEKNQFNVENSGDHHYAKASFDSETKKINAGIIYNFADNINTSLQIVNGKLQGTILHTGDNHILQIDACADGSYSGSYSDKQGKLKIVFDGGRASLEKGKIPETGIEINGDHHKIRFNIDTKEEICGTIESQETKYGTFKLDINGGNILGSFVYKGDNHETGLEISADGSCKASVTVGKGDTKFSFSAEKGKTETKAFAGLKLKF
ncbi:MAG: hypothetical protein V1833_06885 [Elusimicrobiota bacterium]